MPTGGGLGGEGEPSWKEAGDTSVLAPPLAQRTVVGGGEDSWVKDDLWR